MGISDMSARGFDVLMTPSYFAVYREISRGSCDLVMQEAYDWMVQRIIVEMLLTPAIFCAGQNQNRRQRSKRRS